MAEKKLQPAQNLVADLVAVVEFGTKGSRTLMLPKSLLFVNLLYVICSVVCDSSFSLERMTTMMMMILMRMLQLYYTVSQKNDTDVTHYRFNPHQPISVIFGRDVAERVCY